MGNVSKVENESVDAAVDTAVVGALSGTLNKLGVFPESTAYVTEICKETSQFLESAESTVSSTLTKVEEGAKLVDGVIPKKVLHSATAILATHFLGPAMPVLVAGIVLTTIVTYMFTTWWSHHTQQEKFCHQVIKSCQVAKGY